MPVLDFVYKLTPTDANSTGTLSPELSPDLYEVIQISIQCGVTVIQKVWVGSYGIHLLPP